MQKILVEDLKGYDIKRVKFAIREHRKNSPWWPALADLMPYLTPDPKHVERERMRSRAFFSNTPPKQETPEERAEFLEQQERNKIENEGIVWP